MSDKIYKSPDVTSLSATIITWVSINKGFIKNEVALKQLLVIQKMAQELIKDGT